MAYFGFKTTGNFVAWIMFTALFIHGVVWLPIGGVQYAGCKYCKDRYAASALAVVSENYTYVDKGCVAAVFTYELYEPVKATSANAPSEFMSDCINSGPLAAIIAGAVVLGASFIVLIYFFFAKPPAAVSPSAEVLKA